MPIKASADQGCAANLLHAGTDAFVTKLNAEGTALVYSTYLGGNSFEFEADIAVDSFGNAYVSGQTFSPNFPTTPGAFDSTFDGFPPKRTSRGFYQYRSVAWSTAALGGNVIAIYQEIRQR
jgi:hypothetical protein